MQRPRLDRIKQLAQRLRETDQLALKLRSVQIQTLCFKSLSVVNVREICAEYKVLRHSWHWPRFMVEGFGETEQTQTGTVATSGSRRVCQSRGRSPTRRALGRSAPPGPGTRTKPGPWEVRPKRPRDHALRSRRPLPPYGSCTSGPTRPPRFAPSC